MKNLAILTIVIAFTQCEPIPTQTTAVDKEVIYDNHDYERSVATVQLLPIENGEKVPLENPVIGLNSRQQLLLEFDLLGNTFEYLGAVIYHCNKDWTKSLLRDMEFLGEINLFRVSDYDFSLNTSPAYVNYRLILPKPTISGNYIVSVFRRTNSKDILFNRKFLVVQNQSSIQQQVRVSTTVSKRDLNQQIDFSVNYGRVETNNPIQDISVVLLQNHRWQDARVNIQPTLIRPNENYMEFRSLNLDTNFPGWNEFRFLDMRTLTATGRNISNISTKIDGSYEVKLAVDKRRGEVYTQNLRDINGNYILQNNDQGGTLLNSNYAETQFYLRSERLDGKVYVIGRFNNWKLDDENLMRYDERSGMYRAAIVLKQGYYDYHYLLDASDKEPYFLERSHFQTENDYEILVYYRRPGDVHDQLIGYRKFNSLTNN